MKATRNRKAVFTVNADSAFFARAFKNAPAVSELVTDLLASGRSRHEAPDAPRTTTGEPVRKVQIVLI